MLAKFNRFAYISSTFISYGLYSLINRKEKAQDLLFYRLSNLGGIYVKFLQLLVLSDGVTEKNAEKFNDALAVYDQVKYEHLDIKGLLLKELGEISVHIQLDNDFPIAAGSFAQVYEGNLNGQRIVIKALRPSVINFLSFDLLLLSIAIRSIVSLQIQGSLNLMAVFSGFKDITMQEVDYDNEVENALVFFKKLENHPVIYIPKTYQDYSTSKLIIQERIDGWPLTDLFSADIDDKFTYTKNVLGTDINFVMEELAVETLAGSLSDSGAHGDPHPGNIYLLSNNKVALIDFGIRGTVQKYQPELLRLISQFVDVYKGEFDPEKFSLAMIGYYVPELTNSIQTLSAYFDRQDLINSTMDEVTQSMSRAIESSKKDPTVSALIDQYQMVNLFMQVVNRNNRFGLKISIEDPVFIRSTHIFMKIIRRLGCDMQLLRRAWERVLNEEVQSCAKINISYDGESIDNSMHVISGWLDRLCYSDPRLYNSIMQKWGGII